MRERKRERESERASDIYGPPSFRERKRESERERERARERERNGGGEGEREFIDPRPSKNIPLCCEIKNEATRAHAHTNKNKTQTPTNPRNLLVNTHTQTQTHTHGVRGILIFFTHTHQVFVGFLLAMLMEKLISVDIPQPP